MTIKLKKLTDNIKKRRKAKKKKRMVSKKLCARVFKN
jgi:hypothetical protein